MDNNKKEDMVFVSFDRLWDNFKKYWWIAAVLMCIMLIYGAGTYKNAIATSETTDEELQLQPVEIPDDVNERFHGGTVSINYAVDIDAFQAESGVVVNADSTWDIYQRLCQNVILYANSIVSSESFFEQINEAYAEAGYDELVTSVRYGGDDQYDKFQVTYESDKTFLLTYSGIGSPERIALGTNVAAAVLKEELEKMCTYVECDVRSEATVMLYVWIVNNYIGFAPTEETVASLRETYADYNARITGTVDKFSFSFSALFKVSTLIKGVVGFVVGLFIIFIIAVCDKKVRTREELEHFFEGEGQFIGEVRRKEAVSEEVTAVSIAQMCAKNGIASLVLTTVGRQKNPAIVETLAQKASDGRTKVIYANGIEVEPQTTKAIADADGTVIVINSGYDEAHTIKNALSRIHTVNGKLMGYVLYK